MFINGRVDVKLGITTREIYIALKIDLKYTETYSNMDKSQQHIILNEQC